MKKISYWAQVLLLPLYLISFIFPRNKQLWVVGSTFGNRWADNGRYFYLYLNQFEKNNIRPVWISRKKEIVDFLNKNDMESYYVRSLKGFWYCMRAGVYIYDNYSKDICFWTSGGALRINLWHGSGNKKTNYDNKFDYLRHPRNRKEKFKTTLIRMTNEKPSDYVVATSPMMAEIFASAFRLTKDHVLINGYPRNDVIIRNEIINLITQSEEDILKTIQNMKCDNNRICVYMPTFRESEKMFMDVMDLGNFNTFLEKEKIVFMTKLHPKSKVQPIFEKISYSNIVNISSEVDPYVFLKEVDLLVTDYSSIYSDFLLLDRPSVLFPYDFKEYSEDTRECYFDYAEYMPEVKVYTMEELMNAMKQVLVNDDKSEERCELRERIFEDWEEMASRKLFSEICRLLKN